MPVCLCSVGRSSSRSSPCAGALAPRACFISAPLGDTNFRWTSVDEIAKAAWTVYGLYGAPERLQVTHPDCGHLFPAEVRERAYRLLEETLR